MAVCVDGLGRCIRCNGALVNRAWIRREWFDWFKGLGKRHGARDDRIQVFFLEFRRTRLSKTGRIIGRRSRQQHRSSSSSGRREVWFLSLPHSLLKCFSLPSLGRSRKYVFFTLNRFFFGVPLHEKEPRPSAECLNEWRISTEKSKCYFALGLDGARCAFETGKRTPSSRRDVDRSRCKWFMRRNERKELDEEKYGRNEKYWVIFLSVQSRNTHQFFGEITFRGMVR